MAETPIKTASEEELRFIEEKSKDYVAQGMAPEEATKLAAEDWTKMVGDEEGHAQEVWDKLTKQINLSDFIDDQIRRALGTYKTAWEKANPILDDNKEPMKDADGNIMTHTLDFKLELKRVGGVKGRKGDPRLITAVELTLEVARDGLWKVWRKKHIGFAHVREMREGHKWKLALYESMLHEVIMWGVTYMLKLDAYQDGTIKPAVTEPASTEAGQ